MQKKNISTNDNNKKYHKVRDHSHYTGKYRGTAHNICNLRYKTPKTFLWYFIMVPDVTIIF